MGYDAYRTVHHAQVVVVAGLFHAAEYLPAHGDFRRARLST
jgi:hypothetical protein